MDFFDQHPYTYDVQDFNKEAEYDGPSKPLTFTEWGGKAIGQSEIVMSHEVDRLMDLVEIGRAFAGTFSGPGRICASTAASTAKCATEFWNRVW